MYVEPNRRSDYFVALIAAGLMKTADDEVVTPDKILSIKYHIKKSVIITHDPDLGAAGNWQALRAGLKKGR